MSDTILGGENGTTTDGGTGTGGTPDPGASGAPAAGGATGTSGNDERAWLPEAFRNEPVFQNFKSVEQLAASYQSAQRMIGAKGVAVPGKNATDKDWENFYNQIGRPESLDKYEVPLPEGSHKEFSEGFKAAAHKAGLLPKQAQALLNWYQEANGGMAKTMTEQAQAETVKKIEGLKGEWGAAYEKEVNKARAGLDQFADEDTKKLVRESGLGNEPWFIKLMNKVGGSLAEDKIEGQGGDNGLTPASAEKELGTIMSDMSSPYYNKEHPDHRRMIDHVNKLIRMRGGQRA